MKNPTGAVAEFLKREGWLGRGLTLRAPCKLNLRLKIEGRRGDGYHLLSMLNMTTDLHDEIKVTFDSGEMGEISLTVRDESGSLAARGLDDVTQNLAARAARVFLATWGLEPAIDIELTKRIPVGSGLGGGSSDAAAVLALLARVFGPWLLARGVPANELDRSVRRQALALGADVPYFLRGGLAHVGGIGEEVRELAGEALDGIACLIFAPPVFNETRAIYAAFRDLHPVFEHVPDEQGRRFADENGAARDAAFLLGRLAALAENDLQAQVRAESPVIDELLRWLSDEEELFAAMTGSGSAIFALPRRPADFSREFLQRMREGCARRTTRLIECRLALPARGV